MSRGKIRIQAGVSAEVRGQGSARSVIISHRNSMEYRNCVSVCHRIPMDIEAVCVCVSSIKM